MKKSTHHTFKQNYTLFFQTGLILSLLFLLAFTKSTIRFESQNLTFQPVDEIDVEVIEIPNTDEIKPAPAKPYIPIEVLEDVPIEEQDIEFPEFEFYESKISLPPSQNVEEQEEILEGWGVEVMPTMLGGLKALYAELNYPEMAKRAAIEGKVIVQFTVNKLGEVENPEILRGIGVGCNEEVLRVLKKMKFSPGIQNDRPVNVRMTQTVVFKLTN